MIFENLTLFQNILFVISCVSILILFAYLILVYSGYIRSKKKIVSDDIDDNTENYTDKKAFLFNAFTIKGSIFGLALISTGSFFLSMFFELWLAILISVVLGVVLVILMGFVDREPLANSGEMGLVSETIPENKTGLGKIIVLETDIEIDAETDEDTIKKGKKVIILEDMGNKVLVRKYKRKRK